jgi:hypothetical protein
MAIRTRTPLRIAQVSPLYESVPPKLYGDTERVVSYLTEELVNLGHEVTLFASGDSETKARLVPACPKSLRLSPDCIDQLAHHFVMLDELFERADDFDIIHFHIDYLHFPLSRNAGIPQLTLARATGSARSTPALSPISRHAGGLNIAITTHSTAVRKLGCQMSITACRLEVCLWRRGRKVLGVLRAYLPGKAR